MCFQMCPIPQYAALTAWTNLHRRRRLRLPVIVPLLVLNLLPEKLEEKNPFAVADRQVFYILHAA